MFDDNTIFNPFQMNDWEFKKFICVILSIQLTTWGSIGLDVIGLHFPVLRQLISFISKILIIRILKSHIWGNAKTLLHTIGLSTSTLMFTGFLNTFYPYFGISRPISVLSLILTLSMIVLPLCFLVYLQDKGYSDQPFIISKSKLHTNGGSDIYW